VILAVQNAVAVLGKFFNDAMHFEVTHVILSVEQAVLDLRGVECINMHTQSEVKVAVAD
jgi:hypothetical protein